MIKVNNRILLDRENAIDLMWALLEITREEDTSIIEKHHLGFIVDMYFSRESPRLLNQKIENIKL